MIVGIDEVGRGPLAGPVTLCACLFYGGLRPNFWRNIKDSKKLSAKQREEWSVILKKNDKVKFSVFSVSAIEIDKIGITSAVNKAVSGVLSRLEKKVERDLSSCPLFLDGLLKAPKRFKNQKTIIKGDEKIPVISAASILAKVHRDKLMSIYMVKYSKYGFEIHKGYGTGMHMKAIKKFGLSEIHRRSFLKRILNPNI